MTQQNKQGGTRIGAPTGGRSRAQESAKHWKGAPPEATQAMRLDALAFLQAQAKLLQIKIAELEDELGQR
jgi:hypothetical protein